jgi:hypothetical protein
MYSIIKFKPSSVNKGSFFKKDFTAMQGLFYILIHSEISCPEKPNKTRAPNKQPSFFRKQF